MNQTVILLSKEQSLRTAPHIGVAFICLLTTWGAVRSYRQGNETYFRFIEHEESSQSISEEEIPLREVTDTFLRIKTEIDAVQFLERFGPFESDDDSKKPKTVKWSSLLELQRRIRESWVKPLGQWPKEISHLAFTFHLELALAFEKPVLWVVAGAMTQALIADLMFAKLSNSPSAFCARADCGRLFQKTSKHDRKYCSMECAHVESVRKHRARKSTSKMKGK